MIINSTKEFKEVCKTILMAIDTSEQSLVSETLELVNENEVLTLSVTNREYFVSVKLPLQEEETFCATVNANLFLRLVSQLTTDTLELVADGNSLVIKADGTYKLPLIYKDENLLELPRIDLSNITTNMNISGLVLNSILTYNSRELQSAKVVYKPVQKMYYLDDKGAITFTTGACVNSFDLERPVKLLLSQKVVKLFKLFLEDDKVAFELAQDPNVDGTVSTKVRFSTDNIEITAITPSDTQLIESVPVDVIRATANKGYDYSVVLDKEYLVKALSRLALFKKDDLTVALELAFKTDSCTLTYCDNKEVLGYQDGQPEGLDYTMYLNINTLKNIVDGCLEEYLTLSFGDHKGVVLSRQSIKNVIPELVMR